jgi:flagellar motility protein MotE (MotC chaperone)
MTAPARKPRPRLDRAAATDAGRAPALRLLPVVIVAALCLLGFRIQVVVSDMAKGAGGAGFALSQATALAQGQPAAPAEAPAAADEDDAEAPAAGDAEAPAAEGGQAPAEGAAAPVAFNPTELTKSEIETLQRLSERREVIERRERELAQKESLLKAAETRLDQKIAQMQEIEKQLQGLVQQYDAKKKAEIEQLVKIYTAMKPKDAARIFDDLDMAILVPVVTSMKENKVAPILALMNADKARQLTEEMSIRRQIQGLQSAGQEG